MSGGIIVIKREFLKKNGLILLLLVLAGMLRFVGTSWGLPYHLHPDEGTIVNATIRMIEHHSFEPDVFNRPDHLEIQLDMISFMFIDHVLYHQPMAAVAHYHLSTLYLAARWLTASFGVGMILIAYLVGAKIKKRIGWIAAALFALFPGFIEFSHYATPDIPTGFFMLLCIYFCIGYMQKPVKKYLFLSCLCVAAFTVIKYPGIILSSFIGLSVLIRGLRDKNRKRLMTHGFALLIFIPGLIFLISPVLFTNYHAVILNLRDESNPIRPGADGLGYFGNLWFYSHTYLKYSGLLMAIFFFAGVIACLKSRLKWMYLPIFFGFIYFAALSYIALHWERWAVPMYVSPLLISAVGIDYVFNWMKRFSHRKGLLKGIYWLIMLTIVLNFSVTSFAKLSNFLYPDTRVLSQSFCTQARITKTNANFEGYTPLYPTSPKNLAPFRKVGNDYYPRNKRTDYILLSSYMYSRYTENPNRFPYKMRLYHRINKQYKLIKTYTALTPKYAVLDWVSIFDNMDYIDKMMKIKRSGPILKIYKVE